jgi:hypothetical protein
LISPFGFSRWYCRNSGISAGPSYDRSCTGKLSPPATPRNPADRVVRSQPCFGPERHGTLDLSNGYDWPTWTRSRAIRSYMMLHGAGEARLSAVGTTPASAKERCAAALRHPTGDGEGGAHRGTDMSPHCETWGGRGPTWPTPPRCM